VDKPAKKRQAVCAPGLLSFLSDLRRALRPSPSSCNRAATKRFRFCIGQIELARPFACIREGDPNRGTFAVWNLLA
jgi:hypothetical protein